MAILLLYKKNDKEYIKSFWKRVFNFKLIKFKWYVFIILFIPLTNIAAMFANYYIHGIKLNFSSFTSYIGDPLKLITIASYMLILGPIIEELGWRGFLPSSIIMGYIYYKNDSSILAAILFHFTINFYGQLFDIPNEIKPYRTIAMCVGALIILIYEKIQKKFCKS